MNAKQIKQIKRQEQLVLEFFLVEDPSAQDLEDNETLLELADELQLDESEAA